MPTSFSYALEGGISRAASGNEGEPNRDAGASPDDKSRGHDVITDSGFVVGLGKRLRVRWVRVHGDGLGLGMFGWKLLCFVVR
jgi:hypothetical protein